MAISTAIPLSAPARWACHPADTRGRRHAEPAADACSAHELDRERVVHSTAFRRLLYKTQVFVNHEGDLFRTRLTHSIEVAQLARSIARQLGLGEDLVEAIALAHDLGHTPFGHAGQDALHECMRGHGGFEHNLQSLRVVDTLEQRYPGFDGLNLSFETREGILKHCSVHQARLLEAAEPGGVARRFIDGTRPSLEAQVVNLADELTYNAHDIDDGIRSGLIEIGLLRKIDAFDRLCCEVSRDHPGIEARGRRLLFEVLRRMLSRQVGEVVRHTLEGLESGAARTVEDVRRLPWLVDLPGPSRRAFDELKRCLFRGLYRHDRVAQITGAARQVVADLFAAYRASPAEMPADFARSDDLPRAVADYIAGMTDRFALREHLRLTGREVFPGALSPAGRLP